ncbi:MAG: IS1595 family transposase [Acidimicrobiales bacterium]
MLTNTVMHGTKIPVRKWVLVLFEMASNKNGVASREIERRYNLTPKAAWFMLHRIRASMERGPLVAALSGTVVADETWIGGKPKNKHQQGRKRPGTSKGVSGYPHHKTPVLSLVNKETGEIRSRVIPNITGATLAQAIRDQVDVSGSRLHTDSAHQYRSIGKEFRSHEWVDHQAREYVRGDVSTNQAEGFFSQLKRSIDGTHHHVSTQHLHWYLAEFDFRYSTRKISDTARMERMMDRVGGCRLMYRPLITRLSAE